MKIKIYIYLLIINILLVFSNLKADTIFFDSKNIKIENEGNLIFAKKGIAKIPDEKITIEGNESIYNKLISELTVIGEVEFIDNLNDVNIKSEKAIYNKLNNVIFTVGSTLIKIEDKYEIKSQNVVFDRNSMKISSKLDTTAFDNKKNIYNFNEGFLFDTIKEIISSKTSKIIDSEDNNYYFKQSKINLATREIVGKEVRIDFENSFFGDKNNDPLLKGRSTTSNDEKTTIKKAVFSTCNIENKNCRGWELQSDEFTHDKIEKLFEYRDSWLKLFNQKVFFLPYFNHPDPSVKRRSGFLTPVYSSSTNLGKALNIPYFKVLSDKKDMTFNPRIYDDGDFILQSEYRQKFENSNLIADFSFNNDENNTNTHALVNMNGDMSEKTNYSIQFQNVTNDNYLKIHDFRGIQDTNSQVTTIDTSTLTSSLNLETEIDNNTDFKTSMIIYEDLTVSDDNDKYQYIFPDFTFFKTINLEDSYDGSFTFKSSGYQKHYNTNVYEAQLNNDFDFNSFDYFTTNGILSNYNLLLKNYNTYSENSTNFEENSDHELFGTLSLNSQLPMQKEFSNSTNYLKPRIQIKFSPTNGRDISSDSVRLNYGNIFSNNRIGRNDMVEEGKSLTIGLEFEKQNLENEKLVGFNIGNVFKDKKNSSMPSKAKLDQTRSDIVGNFFYKYENMVKLNYDFSYDRDLNFSNYDSISAEFGTEYLTTTFNYVTDNHEFGDSETITNNTIVNFNKEHSLQFDTTKDLKEDFTQYYKLAYEYKTDCLSASFQYQKRFFSDGTLVPDESLKFLIRFIPFAEVRGSADTLVNNY